MRQDAQKEISIAVQDGILEPRASGWVVGEESVGQCLLQSSYRNGIQRPESRAPRQIIRGWTAHALAGFFPSGKRLYDFLKRAPDFRFCAGIGSYAVDREFVRSHRAAPLD